MSTLKHLLTHLSSASPLNGQAAELWDTNMDEFKRNVLARHQDLTDEEME
jgi:ubiquitin-conjugating enzyme E2 C